MFLQQYFQTNLGMDNKAPMTPLPTAYYYAFDCWARIICERQYFRTQYVRRCDLFSRSRVPVVYDHRALVSL